MTQQVRLNVMVMTFAAVLFFSCGKTVVLGAEATGARSASTSRTWRDVSGKFSVIAEFKGFEQGKVKLRKTDGSEISVPLEKLSQADRDWVRSHQRGPAAAKKNADDDRKEVETRQRPSIARMNVNGGLALCVFKQSGNEYKVGTVKGDQATLYATYGAVTISLKDLDKAISSITDEYMDGESGTKYEPLAVWKGLLYQQVVGIWKAESAKIGINVETASDDDPNFLILRADKTFRIIKKGQTRDGTFKLDAGSTMVMTDKGGDSKTAQLARPVGDKLSLTLEESGQKTQVLYSRSNLTKEPKARSRR